MLNRAQRDGGSVAPSRTAAIGGTRVARSAGRRLAITVTPIPATSAITTVDVWKMMPLFGSVNPTASKSLKSPVPSASPTRIPTIDESTPITSDSRMIERSTCRREAPSVRSVASSRVRWAIVIDSEFAITKLPTNSAMPPNASRKSWKMLRNPLVSLVCCWACACPVLTWALGPRSGVTALASWVGEVPGLAARLIWS